MDGVFLTHSAEETRALAEKLASEAQAGDVVALHGDLGAGKTVFAGGFAKGLGVPYPEDVVSPTYTLLQVHEGGRLPLYHFDVYRLEDEEEAAEIGLDEYLFGSGVCLIEWPSRVEGLLPEAGRIDVRISRRAGGFDDREITIKKIQE